MQKWQELELLARQHTLDALSLDMGEDGPGFSFDHYHDTVVDTEGAEQAIFALDGGVETDSRTTDYSISDDHLPVVQSVINDVVIACHAQGMGAGLAV